MSKRTGKLVHKVLVIDRGERLEPIVDHWNNASSLLRESTKMLELFDRHEGHIDREHDEMRRSHSLSVLVSPLNGPREGGSSNNGSTSLAATMKADFEPKQRSLSGFSSRRISELSLPKR